MLKSGWTAALYLALSLPALADHKAGHVLPSPAQGRPHGQVLSVPEIDAASGLLAVAAVTTVLLFVWERSRRRRATQAE